MFDWEVGGLSAADAAAAVSAAHQSMVEQECLLLQLAAHWADLHHPDSVVGRVAGPGRERARRWGGDGTPEVLEFAAAELGARQGTTTGAGRAMLADVRHLRYSAAADLDAGLCRRVWAWRARKVAQATRHLSRDAAAQVDVAVAGLITALPWSRFESVLAAKIIEADPADAELRAKMWEAERFVRTGRTGEGGLRLLVARAKAGGDHLVHGHDQPDRRDPAAGGQC